MTADRIVAAERLVDGWFSVERLQVELGGETLQRDILLHPSGATVLAYDPVRRVALTVGETRVPVLRAGLPPLVEAIAGALDGDDPADCARREAMEEAGVRLGVLEPVGVVWMTPSTSTERVHLFLGEYGAADRVGAGGGLAAEGEHLRVREVRLAQLAAWADDGTLADAKTLLALQALRIRRPALFD